MINKMPGIISETVQNEHIAGGSDNDKTSCYDSMFWQTAHYYGSTSTRGAPSSTRTTIGMLYKRKAQYSLHNRKAQHFLQPTKTPH